MAKKPELKLVPPSSPEPAKDYDDEWNGWVPGDETSPQPTNPPESESPKDFDDEWGG